jgi:hypothetical protein
MATFCVATPTVWFPDGGGVSNYRNAVLSSSIVDHLGAANSGAILWRSQSTLAKNINARSGKYLPKRACWQLLFKQILLSRLCSKLNIKP